MHSIMPLSLTYLLCLALAFSSLNTQAMGLAWLLMVLAGVWAIFQAQRTSKLVLTMPWAKTWLIAASLALLAKVMATFYWSDPWGQRHGEIRVFLGALAIYALLRFQTLKPQQLTWIAHTLTFSSGVGLIWVVMYGRHAVTTHPIPWAGAMAMVSAFLLALSLKSHFPIRLRWTWLVGGLLAVMAVLSSQSRGAYGIVLWWIGVGLHHLGCRVRSKATKLDTPPKRFRLRGWVLWGGLLVGLTLLVQTPILERPAQSLEDALTEIRVFQKSTTAGANSSVGARLYMWQQSWLAIEQSPWIGYGHDTRKKFLREWAEAAQSDEIKRLGHVHNEYLNQLVDHGLLGLGSQVVYLVGLFLMAWQLMQKKHDAAGLSVAGVAFVHMTASLSNVNFSHNYYTASLSLFVGLGLWLTQMEPRNEKALFVSRRD